MSKQKRRLTRKLKNLIAKNEGILPTIVIAEIIQITCEKRGKDMAESRYQALIQSGIEIQNLTPINCPASGFIQMPIQELAYG